jgi:hypothetical protein
MAPPMLAIRDALIAPRAAALRSQAAVTSKAEGKTNQ